MSIIEKFWLFLAEKDFFMKVKSVNLKEEYAVKGGVLDCITMDYPFDREDMAWKRPAVIVIPGGGYAMCSKREGDPIAIEFLARGFQVFVLWYLNSLDGVAYPEQLTEIACAVDYVRKHAAEFSVNPDEVFPVGFSAGGHLTASLATLYGEVEEITGLKLDCKPTATGLCYPVIYESGHMGSFINLTQGYAEEDAAKLKKSLSLHERVTADTPPAFIFSSTEDVTVPPKNALLYAMAMAENGIPFELHVYPKGKHGLANCNMEISADYGDAIVQSRAWLDSCAAFFRQFTVEKF